MTTTYAVKSTGGVALTSDDQVAVTKDGAALMTAKPAGDATFAGQTRVLLHDVAGKVVGRWVLADKLSYDADTKAWSVAL